jgi:hypothetical protein
MANGITRKPMLSAENLYPELFVDFSSSENLKFIQEVLDSSPLISAIVNQNRQIIISNFRRHKIAQSISIEELIGRRPGEVLSCLNNKKNGDCGTTENCQLCGINQTLKQSQLQNRMITGECRLTSVENSLTNFHDFKVTCAPVYFNGIMYTFLNLADISNEKRNLALENVFFHDIMNRLGAFAGIIEIIKRENRQESLHEYIDLLETIGEMVIEEIKFQRELKSAENHELILDIKEHDSFEIIECVRKQIMFNPVMNFRNLDTSGCDQNFRIGTDSTLLKRILLNMAKNAAEATPQKGTITMYCVLQPGKVLFSVHNPGVIPPEIRLQIFQRSFSTKGMGRGLGTYSMKLFGENYLNGKVYFTSDEISGTTFTIELPSGIKFQ